MVRDGWRAPGCATTGRTPPYWLFGVRPPREQIRLNVLGVNHFTWVYDLRWNGQDAWPLVRARLADASHPVQQQGVGGEPVVAEVVRLDARQVGLGQFKRREPARTDRVAGLVLRFLADDSLQMPGVVVRQYPAGGFLSSGDSVTLVVTKAAHGLVQEALALAAQMAGEADAVIVGLPRSRFPPLSKAAGASRKSSSMPSGAGGM